MCEEAGFESVRTYIASGNVVFESDDEPGRVKEILETRLADYAGNRIDVLVRSAREMRDLVAANPFPNEPGNKVAVLFLDRRPPTDLDSIVSGQEGERFVPAAQEIFVHYPEGLGRSRLSFGRDLVGTTRNMNTVTKLAELAAA